MKVITLKRCFVFLVLLLALMLLATYFKRLEFDFRRHVEGIYITWDSRNHVLTVQDDLYLEEQDKLLAAFDFGSLYDLFSPRGEHDGQQLDFEWAMRNGTGFVSSSLKNSNQEIMFNFGRFIDSNGLFTRGIFLGGSPPYEHLKTHGNEVSKNESGMTYYDGDRWYHIWCNVNEGFVILGPSRETQYFPSQYVFVGTDVLERSQERVILRSRHHLPSPHSQITMTRVAVFREEDPYFTLAIRITNRGKSSVPLMYAYGDEPWVGNFGTCRGNVGWTEKKFHYYEGRIDTAENTFIGMADYGNPVIQERGPFTMMANFIEWHQDSRPDRAVFANKTTDDVEDKQIRPLEDPKNRSLMISWGPAILSPSASKDIVLAIGMARPVAGKAMPVKPNVVFDLNLIRNALNASSK